MNEKIKIAKVMSPEEFQQFCRFIDGLDMWPEIKESLTFKGKYADYYKNEICHPTRDVFATTHTLSVRT